MAKIKKETKPLITRKWGTIVVKLNDAYIEADFNHETKKYYMSHGNNDQNVTFNAEVASAETIAKHMDRVKCVQTALEYIKSELKL